MNNTVNLIQAAPPAPEVVNVVRKYILFSEGIISLILNLAVLGVILYRRSLLFNVSGIAVLVLTILDAANAAATLYGNIRFYLNIFANHPADCHIRGSTTSFFIFSSIWMVAILAYSRYDTVISTKEGKGKSLLFWSLLGGVPMLIMLVFCIAVGAQSKFFKMPIGRCMLVDALHIDPLVMAAQIFQLTFFLSTLVIVSFCYTAIATVHKKALKKVSPIALSNLSDDKTIGYHEEIPEVNVKKLSRKVYIKIGIMLFFYYLCLFPTIGFEIHELITVSVRSIEADAVTAGLLIFLGVMNPLMVLVLHEQIKLTMVEILMNIRHFFFRF
ncbi:hypothetical protein K502DRAFT_353556 [Neoconidiobolus thromboides FSU 785]|nr:hypothetical protein K502DRAFT_353556 [Neoconidiobolus thromboides FSU 785]